MRVFDIDLGPPQSKEDRRTTVLQEAPGFVLRTIDVPPGGEIPPCRMASHVVFYVVRGEVELAVDDERERLLEGQCLVTGPATLSMRSGPGARILGVAILAR